MGHRIEAARFSGGKMVGTKTFASMPGLKFDWDASRQIVLSGGNVVTWIDLINGVVLIPQGGVTKSGDYVIIDNGSFNNNSLPSLNLENFYNASPRGIYMLGEIGGAGNTRAVVQMLNSADTITTYYRTTNSGGNSRLGYTNMGTSTFVGQANVTHNAKRCFVYKFGENNITDNINLYEGNTLKGITTRNYTSGPTALGIPVRLRINAPASNPLRIQRLLLYDWNGFNNAAVDAFHEEVKSIFNVQYGSIF